MDEYLEEKKELIKESFKIKNQLQVLNSEYENIKRIYNKLLEEHLDLQFTKNFDKVLVIQEELNSLKSINSKLDEELINLKDELNQLKTKEREENSEKIQALTEESKVLNDKLLEKNEEIAKILEQIKSFEESFQNLEKEKLQGEEKFREQSLFLQELQSDLDRVEKEKRTTLEERAELNATLEENEKNLKEEREKYTLLEIDFEETLEALENIQNKEEASKELIEKLEKELEESNSRFEALETENQSKEKLLEEAHIKEEELEKQILEYKQKNEEHLEYIRAMEEELDKNIKLLNLMKKSEEEAEEKILNYEKNQEETNKELLNLRDKMKEAEELLIFNEKSNVIAMNSITEFEEKVANLEKIIQEKAEEILRLSSEKQEDSSKTSELQEELNRRLEEKNEEILRLSAEKQEEISKINDLQAELSRKLEEKDNEVSELSAKIAGEANKNVELQEEINTKNEEIISLNSRIKEFEYGELFSNNDDLEANKEKEEILEKIKFTEEEIKKLEENLRKTEVNYTRSLHKNYDFRLITGRVLGNFLEEQKKSESALRKLENKLEDKIIENTNLEEKNRRLYEEKLLLEKALEKKPVLLKDNRVDIKNVFSERETYEEKGPDILGSIINNLEKRKEFHLYTTGDMEKEENKGEFLQEESFVEEIKISPETTEEVIEENLVENAVKEEFESLFVKETPIQVAEDINKDETVKINSSKKFVDNKEIFPKEKFEEFIDFLRFMLPQAIETEAPLLEKDMMYFMVSFAFYNYKGDNFWEQLLDKLGIVGNERIRYKEYLMKEMQIIIKMHNFYEVPEGIEDRVGATIIMHSLIPVNQMSTYIEGIKNIYDFDLKGELDRYTFQKFLRKRLQEDKSMREMKSVAYLRKSNNIERLIDYSYEMLMLLDAKEHGIEKEVNLGKEVIGKVQELLDKNSLKKSIFNFGSFGIGKK